MQEANLSASEPVNIDSPEGFLYEWWSLFWDIYNARNNKSSSSEAQIYTEVCSLSTSNPIPIELNRLLFSCKDANPH